MQQILTVDLILVLAGFAWLRLLQHVAAQLPGTNWDEIVDHHEVDCH